MRIVSWLLRRWAVCADACEGWCICRGVWWLWHVSWEIVGGAVFLVCMWLLFAALFN